MADTPAQQKADVLIVDDEEVMLHSLGDWLRLQGFAPRLVTSGMAALEAVEEKKPDVAVVDIKMPGMDGITLLRKIKEIDPDIPVVIITAHATVENAVEAMKQGAYDYIMKPFPPEKLANVLSKVVRQRELEAENVRLRQERKTFLRIAIGVLVNFIVLALLLYFVFGR
ncbi:MAG: sigma-54-dependent Fis family transcriptional regulator [Calditrichaeota bacterium]|nr:sigma-54-dependent Fis family transcriptional regulator [Calditrichota bacterium]